MTSALIAVEAIGVVVNISSTTTLSRTITVFVFGVPKLRNRAHEQLKLKLAYSQDTITRPDCSRNSTITNDGHVYEVLTQYLIQRPSSFLCENKVLHLGLFKKSFKCFTILYVFVAFSVQILGYLALSCLLFFDNVDRQ